MVIQYLNSILVTQIFFQKYFQYYGFPHWKEAVHREVEA